MRALLVIDLQKEFKDNNGEYEKLLKFIEDNRKNYDCVIATLFVNKDNSKFEKELGWTGCKHVTNDSIEFKYDCKFKKSTYAIDVETYLPNNIEYDIIGCDSDACIMATCFRLWDAEYKFNVILDMIYTTGDKIDKEQVKEQLCRNFGYCIKETGGCDV